MDDLLAACRILAGERLTDAFGHVTARADDGSVWLTPRIGPGLVKSADQLLRVSLDGDVLDGDASLVPGEAALHLAFLRARPDVQSVVRFHGLSCLAIGTRLEPLQPSIGFGLFLGVVPVHDVAAPVRDPALADQVAQTLGDGAAILLRGFGALTVGSSVREATVRAQWLERSADVALRAGTPTPYDDTAITRFAGATAVIEEQVARAWAYLSAQHT